MAVLIAAQMKSTVVYGSARRATINDGDEKVAAFSISRVTRLSLDDYFYEPQRNTMASAHWRQSLHSRPHCDNAVLSKYCMSAMFTERCFSLQ
jgi:hypothetical protein